MAEAVAPTRSRRLPFWAIIIALVISVLGGVFVLLWFKLPTWAPEWVVEHSPWVDPIVRAVQTKPALFDAATISLGQQGQRVVPAMIDLLDNSDQGLRRLATIVLGNSQDIRAVDPLLIALNDSDPDMVMTVVEALGKIGDGRAAGQLLQQFKRLGDGSPSEDFLKWAKIGLPLMAALGKLPGPDVANAILPFPAANGVDMEWRIEVAANVNDARVAKALEAVLWEADPAVELPPNLFQVRSRGELAASALVKSMHQGAVEIWFGLRVILALGFVVACIRASSPMMGLRNRWIPAWERVSNGRSLTRMKRCENLLLGPLSHFICLRRRSCDCWRLVVNRHPTCDGLR